MTISRCSLFTSHPDATNSVASQSSRSGWLGGSPRTPKSSADFTRPMPKNCCQKRLTATRAVSGLAGSTNQRARSSRLAGRGFSVPAVSGGRHAGTPGSTC